MMSLNPFSTTRSSNQWVACLFSCALISFSLSGCTDDGEKPCQTSSDCSTSEVCVSQICSSVPCSSNLDCPPDSICYTEDGYCSMLECRRDSDCLDSRFPYCIDNRCTEDLPPECYVREDCLQGETCSEDLCIGVIPNTGCLEDDDCGLPQICDTEQFLCTDICATDADCGDEEDLLACDVETGFCFEVSCLTDEQCGEGLMCTDTYECDILAYNCEELTCDDPTLPWEVGPVNGMCLCVQCLQDIHCSSSNNESCIGLEEVDGVLWGEGRCINCDVEADVAENCPEDTPYFVSGCCTECLEGPDCDDLTGLGSTCYNGVCVPCNCNGSCDCPDETFECQIQPDNTGVCVPLQLAELGEQCFSQSECMPGLACSYSVGLCVEEGTPSVDNYCTESGCPNPSRCGLASGGGALCFGCHEGSGECPSGFDCDIPVTWVGVYDGGQCLPE